MSQLSYTADQAVAVAGSLGELGPNKVRSYVVEGGTASFGMGMVLGTDPDKQAKIPSAGGQVFAGALAFVHHDSLGATGVKAEQVGSLVMQGPVWVKVEQAVTPADPVYLRHTANGPDLPGGWRKDADTANADQITQARWLTSASAGGLAMLELNVP